MTNTLMTKSIKGTTEIK